jgi:hypothetical protein
MRLLGIVGLVTLGLSAAGCADEKSTTVNDDINWIAKCAGGGCTNFSFHDQDKVTYDYKVSCKRSGTMIDITIRDPGFRGTEDMLFADKHPSGQIRITNGDPTNNRCNVVVQDSMEFGAAEVKLIGTCAGSAVSNDGSSCVLTGNFNQEGWDWIGTLYCSKLIRENLNTQVYTLEASNSTAPATPIRIAVDNCD